MNVWKPSENDKLYSVDMDAILEAETLLGFSFPNELRQFFITYGYGFISESDTNINRLLDPLSIADLRSRQKEYEYYGDLDLYEEYEKDKLLFFEANEGILLAIELSDTEKQKIYFYDKPIAESLDDFLIKYTNNNCFFNE